MEVVLFIILQYFSILLFTVTAFMSIDLFYLTSLPHPPKLGGFVEGGEVGGGGRVERYTDRICSEMKSGDAQRDVQKNARDKWKKNSRDGEKAV